jgi:hypothetical protein
MLSSIPYLYPGEDEELELVARGEEKETRRHDSAAPVPRVPPPTQDPVLVEVRKEPHSCALVSLCSLIFLLFQGAQWCVGCQCRTQG